MVRENVNILVDKDESFIKDGTAAMFLATNPKNGKKGILKSNGCMLFSVNEDIREKLASNILNCCGVECAGIELFVDDNDEEYAFSVNVLKPNEEHIDIEQEYIPDLNQNIQKYYDKILIKVTCLSGISKLQVDSIIKRIYEIILIDCLIDHKDRKYDNMKIIKNNETGEYKPPIAYDYGMAFVPNAPGNGIFREISAERILEHLFKEHYIEIKEIVDNIQNNLTDEYINNLFNEEWVTIDYKDQIKNQLMSRKQQIINLKNHLELPQQFSFDNNKEESKLTPNVDTRIGKIKNLKVCLSSIFKLNNKEEIYMTR